MGNFSCEVEITVIREFQLTDYASFAADFWSTNNNSYFGVTFSLFNGDFR